MLIVLYGPDDYRREARRKYYAEQFEKKYPGSAAASFDFSLPDDEINFHNYISHNSLFEPNRLAVIYNLEDPGKGLKKDLEVVSEQAFTHAIISASLKPAPFILKKAKTAEKFEFLEGAEWEKFIKEETAKRGLKLAAAALEIIANVFLKDTWRLVTELEVLKFFGKNTISASDLANLSEELGPDFWGMLMRLRRGNQSQKLAALEIFLEGKEAGAKLFNILASQAVEIFPLLAEYDLAVKSGKLDYEEALLDFAIR